MAHPQPLEGIRVMSTVDRPAGAVCAELLLALGAVKAREAGHADIVLATPATEMGVDAKRTIRCDISAAGAEAPLDLPPDAPDVLMQAWGGMMATTGDAGGPPRTVGIPLIDIFAGINAATASLAALRLVEGGTPAQRIDTALVDTNAGLLGTFLAHVVAGKGGGFRDGCRHPICAPWNAYPTRDGQVMLCSSSDAQWHRLLDLIGAETAMRRDARFVDMAARVRHVEAVDKLVASWTVRFTTAAVVEALSHAGIPAGPIRTPVEAIGSVGAALLETVTDADGVARRRCTSPLRLRPGPKGTRRKRPMGTLPLSGVRILEVGPFTAGPLAGRLLADLGADVVKVEPPGGEVSRQWTPRFGGESGYFVNYNAGKRSIALDLTNPSDRDVFDRLLGRADVLVQNLKTGALEKMGFGAAEMLRRHRGLIYCSISGYGADGPRDPALDTVIQASSGIMALVECSDEKPCKVGFSVADLIAGHLAPLGVLAALRHRDRTGEGIFIDLSMLHALFWAVQSAWTATADPLGPFCRLRVADGWIVAATTEPELRVHLGADASLSSSAAVLNRLREAEIAAVRVRDLGEVIGEPLLARRRMLRRIVGSDGTPITVLAAPYGLTVTPPRTGPLIGPADRDRAPVLHDWLHDAPVDRGVPAPGLEMPA